MTRWNPVGNAAAGVSGMLAGMVVWTISGSVALTLGIAIFAGMTAGLVEDICHQIERKR